MRTPILILSALAVMLAACDGRSEAERQRDIMSGRDSGEGGLSLPGSSSPSPGGSAPGAPAPATSAQSPEPAMMPQYGLTVVLTSYGDRKISVLKAVMEARPDLGLAEAKTLVESTPQTIKSGLSAADATALQNSIQAAGGTVSIQ